MSKDEKKKVKIEKLATLLRNFLVFVGVVIIILTLVDYYFEATQLIDYLFFPLVIGSVLYLIVNSNSSAYKK